MYFKYLIKNIVRVQPIIFIFIIMEIKLFCNREYLYLFYIKRKSIPTVSLFSMFLM